MAYASPTRAHGLRVAPSALKNPRARRRMRREALYRASGLTPARETSGSVLAAFEDATAFARKLGLPPGEQRHRAGRVCFYPQCPAAAVMLNRACDREVDVQIRVTAASAAAPYMFPRLSASIVATAPATSRDETSGLVDRLMRRFDLMAPKPTVTVDATLVEVVHAEDDGK